MQHSVLLLALCPLALAAGCSRESLKTSTDGLVAAIKAGDPSLLKSVATDALKYDENFKPATLKDGVLARAVPIDHARSLLDTT